MRKKQTARQWLLQRLADGQEVHSKMLKDEAPAAGHKWHTMIHAFSDSQEFSYRLEGMGHDKKSFWKLER